MTHRARKPYIAGNWKMNLDRSRSLDLIKTVKGRLGDGNDREVAVFAPSIYLADVTAVAQGSPLGVGGQNIWYEDNGAFTGELAARMLREVGADRVLVGHSERRQIFQEPDEWMGKKMRTALDRDLLPVCCVGETIEERRGNRTERVLKRQLEAGFERLRPEEAHRITVAYEPVWAIGTGKTASAAQAQEVHATIRRILRDIGAPVADQIRVQYGGSVKPENAAELMAQPDVDGALVGGASLDPKGLVEIAGAVP